MRKGGEKRGRSGTIHHVCDVGGRKGGRRGGGAGPLVVSAGPEGCSSSSRLGSNDPRLVGTRRRSTQLLGHFLNLFAVWPHAPGQTANKFKKRPRSCVDRLRVPAKPQISLKSAQEVV